jgi:hypothetical protein
MFPAVNRLAFPHKDYDLNIPSGRKNSEKDISRIPWFSVLRENVNL